jgi:hypothetical protein
MKIAKTSMIAMLLTLVLMVGFSQVALAKAQSEFTIVNKSEDEITVILRGDKSYHITVAAGDKVTKDIDEDKYDVTYSYCGTDYDWELDFDDDYKLVLYPCKTQPTKMQVKSHLPGKVVLKLYGYEDYEINISLGKTKVDLYSGPTTYEYEACDGQVFSGEIDVAKNGTTQLVMHSCEWFLEPARNYSQPNPVKFRIVNQASFPIYMTLIGPENYLVTVNPGINVYTLISGSYKYSYFVNQQLVSGNTSVTKNGIGVLVVTPSYVFDYVDDTSDLE